MLDEKDKNKDTSKPAATVGKGTVSKHFTKSKTKPFLLDAFCLMHKLTPESEISESDFTRKLKEFQTRKIG